MMSVFLDSASIEDARQAASLGYVRGATTNPSLLLKAGHRDAAAALKALCDLLPGTVFYQLTGHSLEAMRPEAEHFTAIAPNLGLKILCTQIGLAFAAEMAPKVTVAITGVFNPAQAYLAAQAGARYVIPYVNRITRYTGDGPHLLAMMADVMATTETEILAAGIKSAAEAVESLLAGADHISLPLAVIEAMAEDGLTEKASADFDLAVAQMRGET
jgi:transaldolase